jgi:hypothetical protein
MDGKWRTLAKIGGRSEGRAEHPSRKGGIQQRTIRKFSVMFDSIRFTV